MLAKTIKGFFGVSLLASSVSTVYALDIENYENLANNTIRQMNSGVVGDIEAMIAVQERLIILGMEGGIEYLQKHPKGGTPLKLVIENAEDMKSLSLDEIEALWHQGGYLKKKGIDQDKIDHFGPMMSLMDSVIHPATSYLLMKEYKRTGNPDLLVQVKAELFEVLEHIKHVNDDPQVQLTANE